MLERLNQRYERRGPRSFWYQAPRFAYEAVLETNEDGFVSRYPGLWSEVTKSPTDYRNLVGHYVFPGAEGPDVRIFVRSGVLIAAVNLGENWYPQPLIPLQAGWFRLGDEEFAPERVNFDGLVDGHTQRMTIQGVPLYRRETP